VDEVDTKCFYCIAADTIIVKKIVADAAVQTLGMPGTGERRDGNHRMLFQGKYFQAVRKRH
jgi:hypothetical protein